MAPYPLTATSHAIGLSGGGPGDLSGVFAPGTSPMSDYISGMPDDHPRDPLPEQPRAEPEIIPPPELGTARWRGRGPGVFILIDRLGHTRRITFAKPGPLAVILAVLAVGAVATAVLLVLLGFVLVWIPLSLTIIGGLALTGFIRGFRRRLGPR
jgi:hypothetical protein